MTNPSVQSQTDDIKTPQLVAHFPLWESIVVILGALLTITGAVISKPDPTLLTNGSPMTEAALVYAGYMFARNLALTVILLFLLTVKARRMLAGFMVLIALIGGPRMPLLLLCALNLHREPLLHLGPVVF